MVFDEFIHVTNFESLVNFDADAKAEKNIQALRVRNCLTFKEGIDGLSSEDFCELFRSIPGLVLIEVEVEESLEEVMEQSFVLGDFKFVCDERPWIVQITSTTEKNSMIFSKDTDFSSIYISGGKVTDRGQPCDENHFDELVKNILPNILRAQKLSLLDLSLTFSQQFFLNGKSNLCQTFLNILANSEIGSVNNSNENEATLTQEQIQECIELVDERNYNGLMLAIELKDKPFIDILIELDFELGQSGKDGKRAVDLTIDNQMFDVFVKLIEMDSPFPLDSSQIDKIQEQPEVYQKLVDIAVERANFLNLVKAGDLEKLKGNILDSFRLHFAYDVDNKTALTHAIEQKQFDVFAFLQSKGFSKGVDPSYDKAFEGLTETEKSTIALCNLKYFQCFTSEHVNLLVKKTKIASRVPNRSESYEEIWKFYNDLDSIPVISEVLKVVALFKNLTISFDFQSLNVHKMHPLQPTNSKGTFFEGGYIYIAAGQWQSDRNEVLGIIAHEFTHCAMKKVYNNKCLPYREEDEQSEVFEAIVDNIESIIDENPDAEKIISMVYNCYQKQDWPAELIVRVPHLLATYKDDDGKIEELKVIFTKLFDYYETITRSDLSRHLDNANFAEQVQALNDEAGLLRLIKNEEIELIGNQAEKIFENLVKVNVVISNSPVHSIAAIIEHIDQHEGFHINVDLRFLLKQSQQIQKLFESNQKCYLVVNCADQIDECQEKFQEILQVLENSKIFLVVEASEKEKLLKLLEDSSPNVSDLTHKWQHLNPNYQKKIMEKVIKFQGNSFPLEKVLENVDSCSALEFLPLHEFVDKRQLSISESPMKPPKFYFTRQFCVESKLCKNLKTILSCDEIVARVRRDNFAIISGIAGSGKSTVLRELASKLKENFPDCWVSIVDLKHSSEVFKSEPPSSTFAELASKLISSQSEHVNFEREVFKHFYVNGKVLLLLDGFDEISTCNKQKVCVFLSKFEATKENQLWITTRLHQRSDLEKLFGVSSFEPLPFDEEEQTKFLIKFWQKDSKASQSDSTLEAHSRFVVKKLNEFLSAYDDESVGIPLLMEIVATTYKNKLCDDNALRDAKTFNLYSLYDELIDQMIATWRYDKGSQSRHDQKQISKSGLTILCVHQRLAMKLLFSDEEIKELEVSIEYDEQIWTNAALVRVGLMVCYSGRNAQREFLHRTLAEFLVAQFILLNLKNESQTQALKVFFKIIDKQETVASQFLNFALNEHVMISLGGELLTYDFKENLKTKIHDRGTFMKIIWTRNQDQIFRLFFEIARLVLTNDEIKLLLQRELRFHENIVQIVSRYGNQKLVKEVFAVLKEFLSKKEIKDLLIDIDGPSHNYLQLAACSESLGSLKALLKIGKTYLSDEQHKIILKMRNREGQNLFLQVANRRKKESFVSLKEITELIVTDEEIKSMLIERDLKGCNILSLLFENGKSTKKLPEMLKSVLNAQEITDLIFNIDNDGNHILKNALDKERSWDVIQTLLDDFNISLSDEQSIW